MISDIFSRLHPSQSKQESSPITLGNAGTLAKLGNEIKLIDSLSLIKFQGSESLQYQGKAAQLLHATGPQTAFTLINTGTPVNVNGSQVTQLTKTDKNQASLFIAKETTPNQITQSNNTTQGQKIENLALASRVVNLTVLSTSTSPATNAAQNVLPKDSVTSNNSQQVASSNSPQQTTSPTKLNLNTASVNDNKINNFQSPETGATTSLKDSQRSVLQSDVKQSNALSTKINEANTTQTSTASTSIRNTNTSQPNTLPVAQIATVTDGKTEFPVISQTELKRGDVVRVLVDANNNVQVLPNKTSNTAAISPQSEALKQSLPKQLSFNDMSQLIKQLHTLNEASPSSLPSQTQQALKQLIQSMPNLAHLTTSSDTMKQAIQTSGTFSESLLVNNNKTELVPNDLKLNLSRLKETQENIGALRLGGVPTEQIANAIERITTTQLRHFSDSNQVSTQNYPLHIELPIKDGLLHNLVQIEINQDSNTSQNPSHERRWLVKLKFDFEETGKFEARTSIQENKVSIIFVAEEKETLQKLNNNMPNLKQQLRDKNIDIEKLDTFQAKLTEKQASTLTQSKQLIDVRT